MLKSNSNSERELLDLCSLVHIHSYWIGNYRNNSHLKLNENVKKYLGIENVKMDNLNEIHFLITCGLVIFICSYIRSDTCQSMTKNLISCEERCPIFFLRLYAARVGLRNSFVEKMIVSGLAVILENGCQIQLSNDTVRTDLRICLVSEIDNFHFGLKQGITLWHFLELFRVKKIKLLHLCLIVNNKNG